MENQTLTQKEEQTHTVFTGYYSQSLPFLLPQLKNKMTLIIQKTVKVSDTMTIAYVKKQSGGKARSVLFTIPKCSLTVVESKYDSTPYARVKLEADYDNDSDAVSFHDHCQRLTTLLDEIKTVMQESGFDTTGWVPNVKESDDESCIYLKVKASDVRNKLSEMEDNTFARATIKLNCVYRSEDKAGASLELCGFQKL